MDTKALEPLTEGMLEDIKKVGEEQWEKVLEELRKTVPGERLELIKGIAGQIYVGGYMAGSEDMHAAIRGIKP